ncbi:MAG: HAMP domain-containing histidine kinase [Oscillospiraceae bacterium]|nr:HAMP domain-containing histidine kinase [Oscillospiraceae bacterium]
MIIKLRNRLIAAIMVFVSIIVLVAFLAIYMTTYVRIYHENLEKVNSEEIITVTSDGQMVLDGQVITDAFVINRISPSLGVYFNLITNASGDLVWIDSALALNMEDYEAAARIAVENPDGATAEFGGRIWQYATALSDGLQLDYGDSAAAPEDLTFIRFLDVTDSHQTLNNLLITLVGLYIVLMIVFFLLARYFAGRAIRPMAEAWESQRQFVADASHELKTPISTLNTNLDILYASREDTIQDQIKWLDNSKKVLSRMMALMQSMLELAKVDEMSDAYHVEEVLVARLLDEAEDGYAPLAEKKNVAIIKSADEDVRICSNASMLQQIIGILMDNAVKYTNEGGEIQMSAYAEKGEAVIKIQNTGDGISPADMDKIFDRFYRGDKARVYREGNYGLGLSIAKSVVEKLGGKIHVQSNAERTVFTVNVPNQKPRRA